jgi:hypothetical protein
MGFTVSYRSTQPVAKTVQDAIRQAAHAANKGRTWLSCEPVCFFRSEDGYLEGGSKPNLMPHPDDVASAAQEGLPDGTARDMLDILCRLSSDHGVDWEIRHDHSEGPVGYIRGGVCDDEVLGQIEAFADLGDILANLTDDMTDEAGEFPPMDDDDDDDDGPSILSFKPKRE